MRYDPTCPHLVQALVPALKPAPIADRELLVPQPQTQPARNNFVKSNQQADEAARWMRDELGRNDGVLTHDQAWTGVRERFGEECAIKGETDRWFSKAVLSAFRKLTPTAIWDPPGKRWRKQRPSDLLNDGGRMLNAKPLS